MAEKNNNDEEITKKQFAFKGQQIEDLKNLDVREFAKHVTSRPRRYILRNFQTVEGFLTASREKVAKKKSVKTHNRDLIVVPEMVGWKIHIHRGNSFEPVEITGEMLGHKLGEFAMTRKKANHSKTGVGATKGSKVAKK